MMPIIRISLRGGSSEAAERGDGKAPFSLEKIRKGHI